MTTATELESQKPVRRVEPHEIQKDARTAPPLSDEQRMERLRKVTRTMDEAFSLPGTNFRVGWDSVIGLVPVVGDLATTVVSGWVIREARQMGISRWQAVRMLGNVGIDMVVGLVPGLGDVADAAFKANTKNMKILEKHVEKQQRKAAK
ncbi:DUF4112 domain-containing protein [Thalassoroseus pseudoceratinae]|uniref:DUF4112 domain-containing protein n=1 Tax=Thalassoroseus pseudoceratinae TaxID=2713176 RepID=UPI00141E8CB9|nr:DUF4112 domain-containing protein [Thalassoroseus pseudoceratinae]